MFQIASQPSLIKHIVFHEKTMDEYLTPAELSAGVPVALPNLSKINIFVGANNSGKSRFVRRLVQKKFNSIPRVELKEPHGRAISEDIQHFTSITQHFTTAVTINESRIPFENYWLKHITDQNSTDYTRSYWGSYTYDLLQSVTKTQKFKFNEKMKSNLLSHAWDLMTKVSNGRQVTTQRNNSNTNPTQSPQFTYIPLMRGLRPLVKSQNLTKALLSHRDSGSVTVPLSEKVESLFGQVQNHKLLEFLDVYQTATKEDYPELNGAKIYTGLQIYYDIRNFLLGTKAQREKVKSFEQFLSDQFFEGQPVELTPNSTKEGVLYVKIGDEEEKPIYDLGDGIQAMIAILYPLKTQLDTSHFNMVIIEEPELNLHPGLQRQLVKALMDIENTQFFLTTHSNHFLESLYDQEDISLYKVKRVGITEEDQKYIKTRVEPVLNSDKSILSDLGVINSSVFLSNCTIWVEGVTDRHLFRHYLKLYQEHLKSEGRKVPTFLEDKHFSFVEYGGANITHWSWLDNETTPINVERLCGTFLLIADYDNAEEGKKADRLTQLQNKLGERFIRLECKETENLHDIPVIGRILSEFTDTDFDLSKRKWVSFSKKPVGKYLDEIVTSQNLELKGKKKTFASRNTVSNKTQFCELGIKHTKKWDDLSEEGKRVTEAIYCFIVNQNP